MEHGFDSMEVFPFAVCKFSQRSSPTRNPGGKMNALPIEPTQIAQLGACTYLMHVLLEEAERRQSGFIRKTLDRVVKDHEGIPSDLTDKPFVDAVFAETLRMLQRADPASTLPELPPAPRPRTTVHAEAGLAPMDCGEPPEGGHT
jgi:hypothetical protein